MENLDISGNGLTTSRIGLGTWAIGGWMWGGSDEAESVRTIQSAPAHGVTLIDTAPVYGFGRSEEIIGKAIRQGSMRDDVAIATKCALEWNDKGEIVRNASRKRILAEADDSLRRLQVDVLDLYQVHWPDPNVDVRETAEAMNELLEAGKIRAIGVSNFTVEQLTQFQQVAPLHVAQNPYNLFERAIDERTLPWCRENDVRLLAYGALCRGLLSGRMHADRVSPGDDLRNSDPKFKQPRFDQYLNAVDRLDTFARDNYGKRVLDLAIRWVLDQYPQSIALWGARQPSQLGPVDNVWGWELDDGARAEIAQIVDECVVDPVGPEFMAPPARAA